MASSSRSSLPPTATSSDLLSPAMQRMPSSASFSIAPRMQRTLSNASSISPTDREPSVNGSIASTNLSHRRNNSGSTDKSGAPIFKSPFGAAYIATSSRSSDPNKIKSLSRKLSRSEDQSKIDFNRRLSENEEVTGLGFHARTGSGLGGARRGSAQSHATTTNTSNGLLQNNNGFMFKNTKFVHPGRKNPRSLTPPGVRAARLARANNPNATFEDTTTVELDPSASSMTTSISGPPPSRSASISRAGRGSITKLPNFSSTSIALKRVGSISSLNSMALRRQSSISSMRSSFGEGLGFLRRGSTRGSVSEDPAARRASIAAARRAFEDKEALKEEEEMRRRGKNAQRGRRRVEGLERPKMVRKTTQEIQLQALQAESEPELEMETELVMPDSPMEESPPTPEAVVDPGFAGHMALYDLPIRQEEPQRKKKGKDTLLRFTTWGKTRLLSVK